MEAAITYLAELFDDAIGSASAGVVKLVDALDSKSSSERSVGSIPTARTILLPFRQVEEKRASRHAPRRRQCRLSGEDEPKISRIAPQGHHKAQ